MTTAPTYAQRRLGSELRRLRNRAGLSLEEVASAFSWSLSKLSRIENAKLSISPVDLNRLAIHCNATDDELARLANWSTQKARPSRWWKSYSSMINTTYEEFISLEDQAAHIHLVDASVIPGILQSRGYAHAITNSGPFIPDPDIAEILVEVRMRRQQLLTGKNAIRVSATLSASALQITMGSARVLNEQLDHLLAISNLANVELRIVPLDSPLAAFNGGLTLFDFDHEHEPSIVYIEYHGGMTYQEGTREVRRYRRYIEYLHQHALPAAESRQLLIETVENQ